MRRRRRAARSCGASWIPSARWVLAYSAFAAAVGQAGRLCPDALLASTARFSMHRGSWTNGMRVVGSLLLCPVAPLVYPAAPLSCLSPLITNSMHIVCTHCINALPLQELDKFEKLARILSCCILSSALLPPAFLLQELDKFEKLAALPPISEALADKYRFDGELSVHLTAPCLACCFLCW